MADNAQGARASCHSASPASIPEDPTGADLAHALRYHAEVRSLKLADVVRPLHCQPIAWLNRLAKAQMPHALTIKRVRQVIAGEQLAPSRPYSRFHPQNHGVDPDVGRPRVFRDPCLKCGVRGDIGCNHQAANQGESA